MNRKNKNAKVKGGTKPSPMEFIFGIVALTLLQGGRMIGRSYNEMNVIVYYGIIPLSWTLMIDYVLSVHWCTLGFVCFVAGALVACGNFKDFCDRVFVKSVEFLLAFNRLGSNYTATSVWICLALPIAVYAILGYLTYLKFIGSWEV